MASDKVISTGLSVKCDRCKKTVAVADNDECDFYRKFAERDEDQKDEHMFVGVLLPFTGESKEIDIDFEYVCPGCAKAILGYMAKIDKAVERFLPKKPSKDKDKAKDEDAKGGAETGTAKPEAKAKEPEKKPETKTEEKKPEPEPEAKTEEKKSSVKLTDEREGEGEKTEPEPEAKPEEPGATFDDNDLFDDD